LGPAQRVVTFRNDSKLQETIHSYLSILEHHDMSNLFNLIISTNESVISSSICEDSTYQNQNQSHDDLANPNHSNAIKISENGNELIEGSQGVAKKRSKKENVTLR